MKRRTAEITAEQFRQMATEDMSEKDFSQMVGDFARLHGWLAYHTWRSIHSEAGFPDWVFVRPPELPKRLYVPDGECLLRDATAPRLIVAELKAEKRKPTQGQLRWLDAFRMAGIPAYVWWPRDWPEIETALRGDE